MYVINSLIAAMIIHIQLVQSQHQVALEEVETSPYRCGEELKLKCTYTGNTAWNINANRIWMDNQTLLMSNGHVSASLKGKYQEGEINTSKKYFILIIKNIMDADLKKNYICTYGIETLQTAVIIGGSCVNCMICLRDCIFYGLLGLLVGFIIELLVNYTCLSAKNHKLLAIITVGIVGLLITVLVAGLIGYYICPCQPTRSPWCILIGFFFGFTFLLILLYQYKFVHKDSESLCHLISLAVLTVGIWIAVKKCNGGNTQSAKSGSSCWPPCRVDQDPETRSHAPVNVGRSSERPTPNKEKGKKPVARVSSQPQTAHHVKTENTASAVSSTEKEPFKPRPLPNIVMTTETPRPLPMMPPGTQQEKASNKLDPIETTGEKKKKKKRRKKETDQTKQTDVENSTEL